MIEVFSEEILMPPAHKRRFQYTANNGNINSYWYVYDTMDNDKRIAKGKFEEMQFKCHYMNKNYYRDLITKKDEQV